MRNIQKQSELCVMAYRAVRMNDRHIHGAALHVISSIAVNACAVKSSTAIA
jgi:hypothetical protein